MPNKISFPPFLVLKSIGEERRAEKALVKFTKRVYLHAFFFSLKMFQSLSKPQML
jgi:hypothetical protein